MADEFRPPEFNCSATDETAPIAAGYRPCGICLRPRDRLSREFSEEKELSPEGRHTLIGAPPSGRWPVCGEPYPDRPGEDP